MMRALWTASTGMTAQQTNVDTISNNLANVNTSGYKKEKLEFKSLLYQTMQRADQDPANVPSRPVNLQVGLGVRPIATARSFGMGNLEDTGRVLDFAIDGAGFFVVQNKAGEQTYSRDGAFKVSVTPDGGLMITTSEGYPILNTNGEPIILPDGAPIDSLFVSEEGNISYKNANGEDEELDSGFGLVQFSNVQGLEAIGRNLFKTTPASGEPIWEADGEVAYPSKLIQSYIEMSNVQVAQEMVNLIVAQRAYELNSKAITTSDEMLQQANNLKR